MVPSDIYLYYQITKINNCVISWQQLRGKVMYNAETSSSTPQYLCAYVSQNDLHHPEMTVRETINFASNMLGANNEFGRSVFLVFYQNNKIK